MAQTIAVIGGGVSGLAAAHRVMELAPNATVNLFEQGSRLGGLIRTDKIGDCLVEQGPDAILTEKPAALELAKRIGLESAILPTNNKDRGAFIIHHGRLERIPEGFSMMGPSKFGPILRSRILSPLGKLRMGWEMCLPRGASADEQSVGEFVRRRFGNEVLERLAQPLMGGIYGTDPNELSLKSTMPRFLDMEQNHRSVTLGLRRKRKSAGSSSGVRYGMFISFRHGVQTLTDSLAVRIGSNATLNAELVEVERCVNGRLKLAVRHAGGAVVQHQDEFDAVVLAIPAKCIAKTMENFSPMLAQALGQFTYGSTATVTYAFPENSITHALNGFGFVVPAREGRRILASTWASKKFAHRAPAGTALIRAFFGGDGGEALLKQEDDDLVKIGLQELDTLLGVQQPPLWSSVARHSGAMPRYTLGHSKRVEQVSALLSKQPGIFFAGNSLYGVGIPDAIRSGESAAEQALAHADKRT